MDFSLADWPKAIRDGRCCDRQGTCSSAGVVQRHGTDEFAGLRYRREAPWVANVISSAPGGERFVIAVIGAGQLGSRHLQSLAMLDRNVQVWAIDPDPHSRQTAQHRWDEASGAAERRSALRAASSLAALPKIIDLAIVSTTADVRPEVVSKLASSRVVRFWVLEKPLAQSPAGLHWLEVSTADSEGAWVNTPFRTFALFRHLRDRLLGNGQLTVHVEGPSWGLLSNAIHYLDVVQFLTGETLTSVSTQHVSRDWYEQKRRGFWDADGLLAARYSGGTTVDLSSGGEAVLPAFYLRQGDAEWTLDEAVGSARSESECILTSPPPLQSEATDFLVERMWTDGTCGLPAIQASAQLHKVFLQAVTALWRQMPDRDVREPPIT